MANANAPFGLRPVRRLDGAAPTYQTNPYQINTANTNKIGCGDLVIFDGSHAGYIDQASATSTPVLGVLSAVEWYDTALQKKVFSPWWTGTTTAVAPITAYVYDDPNMVYEIQSGTGGPVTIASVQKNAKILSSGVGAANTTTGLSTEALDVASIATGQATYPMKIIGLSQRIGNDNTANFNVVEVVLNATNFKAGVA